MRAQEGPLPVGKFMVSECRRETAKGFGRGRRSGSGADRERDPKVGQSSTVMRMATKLIMIMISPMVAPAKSKVRHRKLVSGPG